MRRASACRGVSAKAQRGGDTELGRNWDLRMGFFIPENAAARAAEGDVWLQWVRKSGI